MPCRDGNDQCYESPTAVRDRYYEEFRHGSDVAEFLCAILTTLERTDQLENQLIGVFLDTKSKQTVNEIRTWFKDHKIRDKEKRIREENERIESEARAVYEAEMAAAKLTLTKALKRLNKK